MPKQPDVLPTGEQKVKMVDDMFDRIAGRYERLNRILTLKMDVAWRAQTVRALGLPRYSTVLDVACGTGDLCRDLEAMSYRAIGVDRSAGMLKHAHTGGPLVRGDALALSFADGSVDGLTCGFALRNFESLQPFFAEMARVVRPGGRMALLEVSEPHNPVMRFGHQMYFNNVVPLVGGLLSDRSAYRYLPKSVSYLPPGDELVSMLYDAGFTEIAHWQLSGGIAQLLVGTRAGS
ncbi:MAG: ubiquinone/menaquinone biosynthesis methyltransferase [Acidimicrobiia bacterium]|nr:ubiquinone/menaquinone biosynthesis methyltransferase [Acidimicrobiia bacterium]MBP8180882.1 ubiquinone/menaquinone biosynthesis methyltransferase [Acidimicrobiia bacterium]